MKFTIWNKPYKLALASLVAAMTLVSQQTVAASWYQTAAQATKNALFTLPITTQKQIASRLHAYPSFKTDATEWRLKLLVDDFMDMNNMRPLSYYIDEFTQIIDEDPDYFKMLLFKHALNDTTPDKDEVIKIIRRNLEDAKHSTNVQYIQAKLFLSIRKWVRKDTRIPMDATAEAALAYHASFNQG